MKKRRILAGIMAAVLAAGTLAGCGKGGESGSGSKTEGGSAGGEKVFNFSYNSVIVGLNPILDASGPDNLGHNIIWCETPKRQRIRLRSYRRQRRPGRAVRMDLLIPSICMRMPNGMTESR